MSGERGIDERTEFLDSLMLDEESELEVERVFQWVEESPYLAAMYIAWLEKTGESE